MRLVQRAGSVPESKQEVICYEIEEADTSIQKMIERYAIRVVSIATISMAHYPKVIVVYKEEAI